MRSLFFPAVATVSPSICFDNPYDFATCCTGPGGNPKCWARLVGASYAQCCGCASEFMAFPKFKASSGEIAEASCRRSTAINLQECRSPRIFSTFLHTMGDPDRCADIGKRQVRRR